MPGSVVGMTVPSCLRMVAWNILIAHSKEFFDFKEKGKDRHRDIILQSPCFGGSITRGDFFGFLEAAGILDVNLRFLSCMGGLHHTLPWGHFSNSDHFHEDQMQHFRTFRGRPSRRPSAAFGSGSDQVTEGVRFTRRHHCSSWHY